MILQLFIFAFIFIVLGIVFMLRKKRVLAYLFFLLAVFAFVIGWIVITLYPNTLPFSL